MELRTARLVIRPLRETDWQGMGKIFQDFSQSPYAIYDHPMPTEEGAIQALTKRFADSGMFFCVFPKDNNELLGYVCFHPVEGGLDMGYCFHSTAQGRGYAYESCWGLMLYFRDQRGIRTFTAGTALKNLPSCRLLEKLGFVQESTEELSFYHDGKGQPILFTGGNFIFRG